MEGYCYMCPVCDGRACKNAIPGPGAKGFGDVAIRNFNKWKEIRLNLDTIHEQSTIDTKINFFGREMAGPIFAGPVGAVQLHYGDKFNDAEYNQRILTGCYEAGIMAFTGDGTDANIMEDACRLIAKLGGCGVPTVKPWDVDTIMDKATKVKASGAVAMAMDVDAAGLPFLRNMDPPAGFKTKEQLAEIRDFLGIPFIVKGIMTAKGAEKAIAAGADAIVVSNHGGRVLDQCPATAEVLPAIAKTVKGRCRVLVDGGIRDGVDIFKALALGADGVIMARPFVNAVYQGDVAGAISLAERLISELADVMSMCGASSLSDITEDMLFRQCR